MTAAPAPLQASRLAEQRAHEPSMEEILASIRRIIADDQAIPLTPRLRPATAPTVREEPADEAPASVEEPVRIHRATPARLPGVARRVDPVPAPVAEVAPEASAEGEVSPAAVAIEAADTARAAIVPDAASTDATANSDFVEKLADAIEAYVPDAETFSFRRGRSSSEDLYRDAAHGSSPAPAAPAQVVAPVDPLLSPATDASITSSFQALTTSVFMQNSGMIDQAIRDMLRPMLKQWLDDNLPVLVERLVRAEIERVARGPRR